MNEDAMTDAKPALKLFLSYNRLDNPAVECLAQALRDRGLSLFKDDWYLSPGDYWPSALERRLADCTAVAVVIGPAGLGPWQQREVYAAIDREVREHAAGQSDFRVIPVLLDEGSRAHAGLGFLSQNVWAEAWDPRAADLIVGAVNGIAPAELYDEAHPDPRTLICPYRGLGVFREDDQAFYFGREADVEKLVATVSLHPVVAIVGTSGSGKSSLARAGLIPRLRRQTDGRVWQIATIDHPGRSPYLALAQALLPYWEPKRVLGWSKNEAHQAAKTLAESLESDGADRLRDVVREIFAEEPGTTDLLLLVDQWEELYTHRPANAAKVAIHSESVRAFIAMLLEAVRERGLQIVLTVRADYWGEVLTHHPPLGARLAGEATVHLPALLREELEAVIRKPAQKTQLSIEPALVEALLNDAKDQPGDLPLLEFALRQLWTARTGKSGVLTLKAYDGIGRLAQAIVKHANEVCARLSAEERDAVPGVFAALVQVREERADLRRRARLSELSEAGQAVAHRLADERLLVTSRDWENRDDFVEVAHEALLRHWPMLKDWIATWREALVTIRQLQADAAMWQAKGKDASYLWSHERVREAVQAIQDLQGHWNPSTLDLEFLGPTDPDKMLAELDRFETSHERRALIGDRLALFGDRRKGVGLRPDGLPDIDWVAIDGGEVTIEIREDPNDPNSEVTGRLTRSIASFWMARYPVTITQFWAFLDACHSDGEWRLPPGFDLPAGYPPPKPRERYGNQPVDSINWFDASAFCHWLGTRLGFEVRLPTEFEWQRAATSGDPARTYPWGAEWSPAQEPWRANTLESQLVRSTAAGMYLAGASPAGVLDMAGTVWEWYLNLFEQPDVTEFPMSKHFHVLRGGSWLNSQVNARSAVRRRSFPVNRDLNVGYRVVCSSPSSRF
jgi:formylglycine-generating enzyme required for sulfatase activity